MEKILSDTNKVTFNTKHKVNKEIQHFLDIESSIKNCVDDLFNNDYLSKENSKFLNQLVVRLVSCTVCVRFINVINSQMIYHLLQLVLQHTILQNSLYQLLKNLLLMNILYVIHSLFARKLKIGFPHCLWLRLTFSHSLLRSLWTKQETSVLIQCFKINEK